MDFNSQKRTTKLSYYSRGLQKPFLFLSFFFKLSESAPPPVHEYHREKSGFLNEFVLTISAELCGQLFH